MPRQLLRRLLQELGGSTTALIAAPEELAADFDECGALVSASSRSLGATVPGVAAGAKPLHFQHECAADADERVVGRHGVGAGVHGRMGRGRQRAGAPVDISAAIACAAK